MQYSLYISTRSPCIVIMVNIEVLDAINQKYLNKLQWLILLKFHGYNL